MRGEGRSQLDDRYLPFFFCPFPFCYGNGYTRAFPRSFTPPADVLFRVDRAAIVRTRRANRTITGRRVYAVVAMVEG